MPLLPVATGESAPQAPSMPLDSVGGDKRTSPIIESLPPSVTHGGASLPILTPALMAQLRAEVAPGVTFVSADDVDFDNLGGAVIAVLVGIAKRVTGDSHAE